MAKGFIKLHRAITENWVWQEKPYSKGQAWVDLLLLATWKENKEVYKGKLVERKPGEISASIAWLAQRWGWHRDKVVRFLRLLSQDEMATIDTTTNGTTVIIEKWAFYQDGTTTDTTTDTTTTWQQTQQPPGNRHNNHLAHHKKVKKGEEGSKKVQERQIIPDDEEIRGRLDGIREQIRNANRKEG